LRPGPLVDLDHDDGGHAHAQGLAVDLGGEFSDRPGLDEGGEALVRGRTRDVDAFGQLAHAQAGILDEGGDDAAVDVVEIECHGRSFTVDIGVLSAPGRTAPGQIGRSSSILEPRLGAGSMLSIGQILSIVRTVATMSVVHTTYHW